MNEVIEDIFKKDFDEVEKKGIKETNERVARDMLKENLPLSLIAKISKLSEDVIRSLAVSLGVPVV